MPVKELMIDEFLALKERNELPTNVIYKVVFKEEDIVEPVDEGDEFELYDYYDHPEKYHSKFEQYIPHLTILMNCMYWDDRYPRIVTKDYLEQLYKMGEPRLKVIGDVTCDPDGSIECTHKGTEIEDPVFVYDPFARKPAMGFEGNGILVMAVDILPSELPRESSIAFSNALWKYVKQIAEANYQVPFAELDLPGPVKRAMILHKGELTEDYRYIQEHL
jgi:alpha-aminoadipic semialdehyde synthase